MKLAAALDLSGIEVSFAVADFDSKKVFVEQFKHMRGRDSACLLLWMEECLSETEFKLTDISEWTVGTGPGSFTGLRLVASLISGFAFQNEKVRTRTLPSVMALAVSNGYEEGKKIASLHDGRRSEVLLFGMECKDGAVIETGDTRVLATTVELESATSMYDKFTAVITEKAAIEKAFGDKFATTVNYEKHLPVSELIFIESDNWGEEMTDLVYIRPAVFVQPRQVRNI